MGNSSNVFWRVNVDVIATVRTALNVDVIATVRTALNVDVIATVRTALNVRCLQHRVHSQNK